MNKDHIELSKKIKTEREGGGNKKNRTFESVFKALARFLMFVLAAFRKYTPRVAALLRKLGGAWSKFAFQNEIGKKLYFPLLFLLIFCVLPSISKSELDRAAYNDVIKYSAQLDPIEAGQFVSNMSVYFPTVYVDPDQVVLNLMSQDDSYTLTQQLAMNGSKGGSELARQAASYTLAQGETITQVAQKFNLHVATILDANNIKPEDLKKIKSGTVLDIPSSDTNTSSDWLVAVNKAEIDAKKVAAQKLADSKKKAAAATGLGRLATTRAANVKVSSNVTIIGVSYEQCIPWARENSGVQVRGYAGDVQTNSSVPKVGSVALDRFFGHASVVVGVGDGYITVHEANWIRGKITERQVSTAAIRGYVY